MYSERIILMLLVPNTMAIIYINALKELVSLRRNISSLDNGRNCGTRVTISISSGGGGWGGSYIQQGPQKSSEIRTWFDIIGACRGGSSECVIGHRVIINSSGIESQTGEWW